MTDEAEPDKAKADDVTEKPDEAKAETAKPDAKAKPTEDPKKPTKAKAAPKLAGMPAGHKPDVWDYAGAWLAKHGALPVLALIALVVLIMNRRIFTGETTGDDLSFHFAESARIADCIRHFDFDWWNPSANGGYASAYYYQVLPQLMSALPAAIFGHHLFWFQLSVVLPLVIAPFAAYRGMRLLGASPWQSTAAAFLVAFMNGASRWGAGAVSSYGVGLYTQTWALSVFPLALGHGARWITERKGLAPAIAWGAFTFLCHPFAGITLGISFVMAFLVRFFATWRLWTSPTMIGVIALYLGGLPLATLVILGIIPNAPFPESAPKVAILGTVLVACGAWLVFFRDRRADHAWRDPTIQRLFHELNRLAILGGCLVVTTAPVLLPLTVDSEGFGGFPHRVADEVGPGFKELAHWYYSGDLLDFRTPGPPNMMRIPLLTYALPVMIGFTLWKRVGLTRWLWTPSLVFAALLGLGPHIGKLGDDIFPPVRALGAMQIVFAMGIGAGFITFAKWAWDLPWDKLFAFGTPVPKLKPGEVSTTTYTARTALAGAAMMLVIAIAVPGYYSLFNRAYVMADGRPDASGKMTVNNHRDEMMQVIDILEKQPQGRKQASRGAENHWWNLLPYAYGRIPAVLQMGGGGLQASPNYDFLWTIHDPVRIAWIFDAPYITFDKHYARMMPAGETIGQTTNFEVRRLPAPGLVSPAEVIGVLPPWYHAQQLGRLFSKVWGASNMPLQSEIEQFAGSNGLMSPPAGRTLRSWRQESPGDQADIVAEVQNDGPTTYWVHESWHPRWHAYVDKKEVPVRRVTPDFMAVDVMGTGQHTIEMRFERPLWAWLVWLLWPVPVIIAWLATRKRGESGPIKAWLLRRRRPAASATPA